MKKDTIVAAFTGTFCSVFKLLDLPTSIGFKEALLKVAITGFVGAFSGIAGKEFFVFLKKRIVIKSNNKKKQNPSL